MESLMLENFDLWNFLGGMVAGGLGGALVTLNVIRKTQYSGTRGNSVDQTDARAGGDIVGRDKHT